VCPRFGIGHGSTVEQLEFDRVGGDQQQLAPRVERENPVAERGHAPVFSERRGSPCFALFAQVDAAEASVAEMQVSVSADHDG